MECPKCHGNMETVSVQGVAVERCSACSGLWFDELDHDDLQVVSDPQSSPIVCPKGHGPMKSIHIVEHPHIGYEHCDVCNGAFMDAGELHDFGHETFADFLRDFFVGDE